MQWIIERYESLGTTMDVADRHARAGAPAGFVVLANLQTDGRGQRGRRWVAPAGTSLLMTAIARPACTPGDLERIPVDVGRHVASAVERETGLTLHIKPPNDLMIGGRKTGGILCQSSIERGQVQYVLVGIGLNVNIPKEDLPLSSATSLRVELSMPLDLEQIRDAVLDELAGCWCFARKSDTVHPQDGQGTHQHGAGP